MQGELREHEARVLSILRGLYGESNVLVDVPGQYRCPCPCHGGDGRNMVVYMDKKGIRFKCFSGQCTHDDIRKELNLSENDLKPPNSACTLAEYAEYKQIPEIELAGFGLADFRLHGKPAVVIPYFDENRKRLTNRFRVSLTGDPKIRSQKGGGSEVYGLWKLSEAVRHGYLTIVEGESDCHTLWFHGIPAVGVPGAQQVNLVMASIEAFLERHPEMSVYVVQEPDAAGATFIRSFSRSSFRDRLRVISLGEFKDPSDLHIHTDGDYLEVWDRALTSAVSVDEAIVGQEVEDLFDLKPEIDRIIAEKMGRNEKLAVAELIGGFLLQRSRLLVEESSGGSKTPYIIVDRAAIRISSSEPMLRFAVQDTGLNPSEPIFGFLVNHLEHVAIREGIPITVHRYSTFKDGMLYVSSGPKSMIVVFTDERGEVKFRKRPNGFDGILFDSNSVFAEWNIKDEAVFPIELRAFAPNFEARPEVPTYDEYCQHTMLFCWLVGVVARVQMPILVLVGGFGSGKSLLLQAIAKLFMGEMEEPSQPPSDVRTFYTASTTLPVYAIDNLDSPPQPWMDDAIAAMATGVSLTNRALFTDSKLHRRSVVARLAISTRTAEFIRRKDVFDRTLPLFFGPLEHQDKVSNESLLMEVVERRSGILQYLALVAFNARTSKPVNGLPIRYQDYGNVVVSFVQGEAAEARSYLEPLESAQQFAIKDPDPLTQALLDCKESIEGNATAILAKLKSLGYERLPSGGGKRLAKRLRECQRVLALVGRELAEEQRGGTTYFTLLIPAD